MTAHALHLAARHRPKTVTAAARAATLLRHWAAPHAVSRQVMRRWLALAGGHELRDSLEPHRERLVGFLQRAMG